LRANTCQFFTFTFKIFKTCFGQYGHPQVLTFLMGETAAIVCAPPMRTYVCNMGKTIFVIIFVSEVSLYCVVTCLCIHSARCVAPRCFQLSVLFLNVCWIALIPPFIM
jgi:hypothetical protein